MDKADKSVKDFCADAAFVINALHDKNRTDYDFADMRDMFMIAKREQPNIVVERAGAHIWAYREHIKNNEIKFFLENDYSKDIANAADTNRSADIISKCKESWSKFTPAEQNALWTKIKSMLKNYAQYLAACKSEQ